MSGFSESTNPGQDGGQQSTFDANQYQAQIDQQLPQQPLQQPTPSTPGNDANSNGKGKQRRSSPIPRIRRACTACHSGKTRCSEVLPCQSCLKRGLGATCQYPDPESESGVQPPAASAPIPPQASFMSQIPAHPGPYYYDYSASTSTFRPAKRPRPLTEDEAAAITRNFQRGDFYVGNSGPVRIDPRLPVRLTLGEGDHVHFTISEAMI
ncbi:hypothetical protein M0805_000938 [Coniferiporia weirii]|nr:hypothetical protein M0805_000938 [Coniferiporia weirii]